LAEVGVFFQFAYCEGGIGLWFFALSGAKLGMFVYGGGLQPGY
jgi:hypothetical protein